MLDFVTISVKQKETRKGTEVDIFPKFIVSSRTKDLMIRGGDFYAVWDEDAGLWSKDEDSVNDQVDRALDEYKKRYFAVPKEGVQVSVHYMWDSDSGSIDRWHKFVQKQMRDKFEPLDEKITFSNTDVKKKDFVSKRLPYPFEKGPIDAYDELMSTLYDPEEREKLEWAIGAIISGDAKRIQKFEVLYGSAGSGKSTFLNIVQMLFDGYYSIFDAKQLASANNAYALESFKNNPLVSIQHDGDLSRIEDNTKLNSIVSHEEMEINEKYSKLYTSKFNTFLFMGTNKPVKITEAKSGLIRRLIDVKPSGRKVPYKRYQALMSQIRFELGAIAAYCLDIYKGMGENYYDTYIPTDMISATNDFYDFVDHNLDDFKARDMITLTEAWNLYKEYCDFAGAYQMPLRVVRIELRNYFKNFEERAQVEGKRYRNLYSGFLSDKFDRDFKANKEEKAEDEDWLIFKEWPSSPFDDAFGDWKAQYAKENGSPDTSWKNVKTFLRDLDPHKLHWVLPPEESNLICIDFDICDENGEKNFELNSKAAAFFPRTYAELSKSGGGIHLYYFYDGDASKLSRVYDDHVEVKVFTGNSSLRRMLTKCNDINIATINTGLPLKGEAKVVNWDGIKNEKMLRTMIRKNLHKEYHPDTTSSVDYIKYLLDQAYDSGIEYDVSDMQNDILLFAMGSTNQSEKCVNTVGQMRFRSEVADVPIPDDVPDADDDAPIVFFDCEVYQNLFVICWKYAGSDTVVRMINPTPEEVEDLFHFKLIGFNCRKYDNHILYARAVLRYTNEQLYDLSQTMITKHTGFFGPAYDISYTDVYDFSTEKMGLKKWEIKLDIHHQEMGIPWDQPAPEDRWDEIAGYCENDVRATEAVFNARQGDFMARKIQVELVKLLHGDDIKVTVNDTTNTLSKRIIFGANKNPQGEFNYRNLALPVGSNQYEEYLEKFGHDYKFRVFNADGLPEDRDYIPGEVLPDGWSILPFFPGYEFGWSRNSPYYDEEVTNKVGLGKSLYLGEKVGEGGRVYSVPGMYDWVYDGDISSQHPHSIKGEVLFGPRYTKIFSEIVEARVAVKHKDFDTAGKLLGGALKPYLKDEYAKDLAQALKIVINSIYGLTKAGFVNEFRDPRNEDNIVAKRGALFMTLLKREVEKRGFMVCHIKTDSIKIPMATQEIIDFVVKFGREYGYEFETEGVFTKFCLLNDAAYAARLEDGSWITKATLSKDSNPYIYKKLFSHEKIEFNDLCETKSVTEGALYLDRNEGLPDVTEYEKELDRELNRRKRELKKNPDAVFDDSYIHELEEKIKEGHNYVFVGRVGLFTPVVAGSGGGYLYRVQDGRYYAAGGTTGYRFLESEHVKKYGMFDKVDMSYYKRLVDEAVDDISKYGDVEWFLSDAVRDKPVETGFMNIPDIPDSEVPWDELPWGPPSHEFHGL